LLTTRHASDVSESDTTELCASIPASLKSPCSIAVGGNVDAAIGGPASGLQSADKLHFIGVFRPGGEPAMPDVVPLKTQGFEMPDINQVWYTYAAPKTPEDRLAKLESAFATALKTPAAVEAQRRAGFPVLTLLGREQLKAIRARSLEMADTYRAELQAG
jgi:tripartite-type tricarboxylate transporter receptor subunit TctC